MHSARSTRLSATPTAYRLRDFDPEDDRPRVTARADACTGLKAVVRADFDNAAAAGNGGATICGPMGRPVRISARAIDTAARIPSPAERGVAPSTDSADRFALTGERKWQGAASYALDVTDVGSSELPLRTASSDTFTRLFVGAMDAITSPASLRYIETYGNYSPDQRLAIEKFIAHVMARSVAPGPAAQVFFKGPLTHAEQQAWEYFVARLPTEPALPVPRSEAWRPVDVEELRSVFADEPVFAAWMDKPEGRDFVNRLAQVVNDKTRTMLPTDRGMALLFRFDSTYGSIAHLVLGALWRDASGGLRLSLIHQESVPPQRDTGVWTGVVHGTLDTSASYPGGRAPVVESMRLIGLPSVNVFPCPRPEAIQHVLADLAGVEKRHPYGATDNWNDGQRGTLPAGRPFVTCFNVTHRAMAELYDTREEHAPGLPNTLVAMQPLISSPPGEFDTVTISSGAEKREIRLADVAKEPAENVFKTFTAVGERWGRAGPWDVDGTLQSRKHKVVLAPGKIGVPLPEGARMFKFIAKPTGLMLNGRPVAAEVVYSPDEAARMEYRGTKSSAPLPMVVSVQRAKL